MKLVARQESAASASGDIVEVKDIEPSLVASSERYGKATLRSVPKIGVLVVKKGDTPCRAAQRSEIRLVRSRARVIRAGRSMGRACRRDQQSGQPLSLPSHPCSAHHDASNAAR
jgi:hypothetical protein